MSQYIGDLKDYENLEFFEETYERYCKLFKFYPDLIITDLHPAYLSTVFGESLANNKALTLAISSALPWHAILMKASRSFSGLEVASW